MITKLLILLQGLEFNNAYQDIYYPTLYFKIEKNISMYHISKVRIILNDLSKIYLNKKNVQVAK